MWAMAIVLLTVISCSETETDLETNGGNDDLIALGITPNLKVDAGSKASTKSVMGGDVIKYKAADYMNEGLVPGLGILLTNGDANGWYTPEGKDYEGHHVWYMGSEKGDNWISIKTRGNTFKTTKEVPYYLSKEVGRVYAYYPYDPELPVELPAITRESDLKIPVTVLAAGEIDATTNNAKKYWDGSKWVTARASDLVNLSLTAEKDYLYFVANDGRYVNNGRAEGEPPVKPDDYPDNSNERNPGYSIFLDMKHAMSMVSFRVYDGSRLSEKDVRFTRFEIRNSPEGSSPFKIRDGYMSLVDGAITDNATSGTMTRTISNYVLMRQVDDMSGEGENDFYYTGPNLANISGWTVSKMVSAVVYPTTFTDDEIVVSVTLQEQGADPVVYLVTLPSNMWEANNNYIYTLSAGRNKLTVMDVTVEQWVEVEEAEIPL